MFPYICTQFLLIRQNESIADGLSSVLFNIHTGSELVLFPYICTQFLQKWLGKRNDWPRASPHLPLFHKLDTFPTPSSLFFSLVFDVLSVVGYIWKSGYRLPWANYSFFLIISVGIESKFKEKRIISPGLVTYAETQVRNRQGANAANICSHLLFCKYMHYIDVIRAGEEPMRRTQPALVHSCYSVNTCII